MDFKDFLKDFFKAVKGGDRKFVEKVYGGWFDNSGFPKDQKEQFFHAIFQDLGQMLGNATPQEPECFDDYCIARLKEKGGDGVFSLTFRKKGQSWEYFNERTNFSQFSRVYGISYQVLGKGSLRILFNGKRSPAVADIEGGHQGFISLINSALKKGENELTLVPSKGLEKVSIRISSGREGEQIDSAQGDVLIWDGDVKEEVKLKFKAE